MLRLQPLCRTFQPAIRFPPTPLRNHIQTRFYQRRPFGGRRPQYQRFGAASGASNLLFRWVASPTFFRGVGILSTGAGGFYWYNLEEVPVSGRRRFNFISPTLEAKIAGSSADQILAEYEGRILPDHDPRVRKVRAVLERLIPYAEGDGIKGVEWELNVIDSSEVNAFVVPGGKVFVFTGILPVCKDDDGIAAVLGHEIAHVVARHSAEKMSQAPLLLIPLAISLLFDFSFSLANALLNIFLSMPASRKQEAEADYIGLLMMANGCYNPDAAMDFWARMDKLGHKSPPPFLSTHPSNQDREAKIREWLPLARDKREASECHVTSQYADQFHSAFDSLGRW